jgi:hypothetical protein
VAELVVPILSRRRDTALAIQKAQHVIPALPLLFQGVTRLRHEPHGWSLLLAVAEVAVSAVVVAAFVRQLRDARSRGGDDHEHAHGEHLGVDWVDLLIGVMLGVEVWAHWYETGHVKRPTVFMAVGIFAVGLLHGRIFAKTVRRRSLCIDDDAGIAVGGKPFRNFRARWDELAAIEIEPRQARLVRTDGRTRVIDFDDVRNAADVRAALEGARLRLPAAPVEDPVAP